MVDNYCRIKITGHLHFATVGELGQTRCVPSGNPARRRLFEARKDRIRTADFTSARQATEPTSGKVRVDHERVAESDDIAARQRCRRLGSPLVPSRHHERDRRSLTRATRKRIEIGTVATAIGRRTRTRKIRATADVDQIDGRRVHSLHHGERIDFAQSTLQTIGKIELDSGRGVRPYTAPHRVNHLEREAGTGVDVARPPRCSRVRLGAPGIGRFVQGVRLRAGGWRNADSDLADVRLREECLLGSR